MDASDMGIPENAVVRICVNADRQAELPLMLQQRSDNGQCVKCEAPVIFDRDSVAEARKVCRQASRPHVLMCEQCASRLRLGAVGSFKYPKEMAEEAVRRALEERN